MKNLCRRNALLVLGPMFALGTYWAALAVAQEMRLLPPPEAPCPGQLSRPHPLIPYNFTTNSMRDGTEFLHCVHNNQNNAVDIRWLVPGLKGIVPPNESAISPRYSAEVPIGNKDGCLIYGNVLEGDLKTELCARQEDQDALDKESTMGTCRNAFGSSSTPATNSRSGDLGNTKVNSATLKNSLSPFRFFVPANTNLSTDMIAFEGVVGIRTRSENSYELVFGLFRWRERVHFPFGSRYGAEFLYCLGLAGT
jgi:hypothetical protein